MQETYLPAVRVIATPQDTNFAGSVFGGYLLGLMDQAAAVTGVASSRGAVVTAAVRDIRFEDGIRAGEIITIYSNDCRIGTSSMEISLEVFAEDPAEGGSKRRAARGLFVIVAVDRSGKPRKIAPELGS